MMKKMVLLFALAVAGALTSCEKPMNEKQENEIRTVSFYAEMKTISVPKPWENLIGSKNGEIAKTGALFLVNKGTVDKLVNQYGDCLCSWKKQTGILIPPVDSNYIHNPNDLISLFDAGIIEKVSSIHTPCGKFNNIPHGEYEILCVFGMPHQDTLKTFNCSYSNIIIDDWSKDTIELGALIGHDNFWAYF